MKTYLHKLGMTLALTLVSVVGWAQLSYTTNFPQATNISAESITIAISYDNFPNEEDIDGGVRFRCIILPSTSLAPTIANINNTAYYNNAMFKNATTLSSNTPTSLQIIGLTPNTDYIAYMVTRNLDLLNNIETLSPTTISFKTPAPPTPPFATLSPIHNSTTALIDQNLVMTFNEDVELSSGMIELFLDGNGSIESFSNSSARINLALDKRTLTINPSLDLTYNTSYYVTMTQGFVKSVATGTPCDAITGKNWFFTTKVQPIPPVLTSFTPANNASSIAINTSLLLTFDKAVTKNLASKYLKIIRYNDDLIKTTFDVKQEDVSISNNIVTITSNMLLAENTKYYIAMDEGFVQSSDGGNCALINNKDYWTFTTINNAPVPTFTPSDQAGNVSMYPTIEIAFNKPIRYIDNSLITNNNVENIISTFKSSSHTLTASDYTAVINETATKITIYVTTKLNASNTYTVKFNNYEDFNNTSVAIENLTYSFTVGAYSEWTGALSTSFEELGNWSPVSGFVDGNSVLIPKTTNNPILNADAAITNLIVKPGASFTVNAGKTLTITNQILLESDNSNTSAFYDNGTITLAGNSKIRITQRISTASRAYYIGSPLSDGSLSSITRVYERVYSPTFTWNKLANPSFIPGKGFAFYGEPNENVVITGTQFNNSNVDINTIRNSVNFGWHLASNPYPFSIDWCHLSNTITNLKNSFLIRLNDKAGFGTYNGDALTGVNGLSIPFSVIPAFHAFYIQTAIDQTSGSLTLSPSSFYADNRTYLKSTSNEVKNPIVKLKSAKDQYTDEIALVFNSNGSNNLTNSDSEKMLTGSNSILELYQITDNDKKAAIKILPELTESKSVKLGYQTTATGTYSIGISELTNFESNVTVKIEDKSANKTTELTNSIDYSFEVKENELKSASRFVLHLSPSTSTSNQAADADNKTKVIPYESGFNIISYNGEKYEVINISGQIIKSGLITSNNQYVEMNEKGLYLINIYANTSKNSYKILINH